MSKGAITLVVLDQHQKEIRIFPEATDKSQSRYEPKIKKSGTTG